MYNFPFYNVIGSKGYITTRCTMPSYTKNKMDNAIDNIDISIGEIEELIPIDKIPEPNFLMYSIVDFIPKDILDKIIDKIKLTYYISIDDIEKLISSVVPPDNIEMAEWMYDVCAYNIYGMYMTENYNQSNSSYVMHISTDGYIPDNGLDGLRFISRTGTWVHSHGNNTLITPHGRVSVPVPGGKTIIYKDLLSWCYDKGQDGEQHTCKIFKWHSLAETIKGDIKNLVCTKYYGSGDNINPQFFAQNTNKPVKMIHINAQLWSPKEQRVNIFWRDPRDYTTIVHRDFIDVPAGLSSINTQFGSTPYIPPLVAHISPKEDSFVIKSYCVTRR